MMSDSDESDTSSNVFTFPNMTTVSAKGPNTNVTTLNFPNQLTSMCMPRNFAFDQKSMYYRRETSPMSTRSAYDIRSRNCQQYYRGMSSQRSVFNGRSGSPMSMRSIDSSASVSAAEIVFALKNTEYNQKELRMIKDAYHKLMKQRVRKRIEKRRNMRLFLKGSRQRSGDDSGEQGSDSSLSSDECRSVKTTYKENMSSAGSARIDLTDFRKSVRDNSMLKDWSNNFRHNTIKNNFSNDSRLNNSQKDRFKNGFLLPSQRFNRSVASLSIPETSENLQNTNTVMNNIINPCNQNNESGSGDEIFSKKTVKDRNISNVEIQRKRGFHSIDEDNYPGKKKYKMSSHKENLQTNDRAPSKTKSIDPAVNNIETTNTFEFVKPLLPVRKSKPKVQEKLISKSSQPLTDFLEPTCSKIQTNTQSSKPFDLKAQSSGNLNEHDQSEMTQPSDVSMRPSFIKRKLFTQKLDVAENANLSTDGTNSPQNVYLLQKEKNKARKLVTNQSCLNREVQDDNNLLDLIHKIVPPDQMNISNQTMNQNKTDLNSKNKQCNKDKWDVSSVISRCNGDDVSDTYTDEEIFEGDTTKQATEHNRNTDGKTNSETNILIQINQDCKVVMEKLQENKNNQKLVTQNLSSTNSIAAVAAAHVNAINVKGPAKSFWDTDSESEAEWSQRHVIDKIKKANALLEARRDGKSVSGSTSNICNVSKYSQPTPDVPKLMNNISMNNTVMNNTLDSNRKFDPSSLSIRSHRTPKKKKCCNETCATIIKTNLDNKSSIIKEKTKLNTKCVDQTNLKTCAQIEENPNLIKTPSHCMKNSKGKKSKVDKQDRAKKDTKKLESSKPAKFNTTVNSVAKLKPQNSSSKKKHETKNKFEIKQVKTISKSNVRQDDQKNTKNTLNKSPKNKHKSKISRESSTRLQLMQNTSVLVPNMKIQNKSVDPLQVTNSGRPLRSCRTPSQSRSIELSRSSQFNNTSESTRSLRSRVIDLSSSIENISIKIKPKNKTKNNKITTIIQTRKSDVSFSLGFEKRTVAPKK